MVEVAPREGRGAESAEVRDGASRFADRATAATATPIEITRDRWTVRVGHGVDRETLAQVLDAIAAHPC